MAEVIIGGAPIAVALPNFRALKAAWRYIDAAQGQTDPMAGIDAILGVVSVGAVGQTLSVELLEERLRPAELPGLRPFLNALIAEIGLAPGQEPNAAGERRPARGRGSPSTATSTPSSPNSSPRAAETGTGSNGAGT